MNKLVLSIALCSMMGVAFADVDVDVVDDSQNYVLNEPLNKAMPAGDEDNSVFVLSDNSDSEAQQGEIKKTDESELSTLQLLLSKVESMQLEIAELRGMLERQGHQLETAGLTQVMPQKANVNALTPVVTTVATTLPVVVLQQTKSQMPIETNRVVSEASQTAKTPGDPMDEQLIYVAAYEHVKHKRFKEAVPAMQAFIKAYPQGPYVANAHYWLGELYGVNGEYEKALTEFQIVINDFSDSSKLSSAQYKLGVTYEQIGKTGLAQSEFVKVTEAFPGTSIARLAQARLK